MKPLNRETLFKPTRSESKQATTDGTVREMIDAESRMRREKTARLREMRLAREADGDEAGAPPERTAAKDRRANRRS